MELVPGPEGRAAALGEGGRASLGINGFNFKLKGGAIVLEAEDDIINTPSTAKVLRAVLFIDCLRLRMAKGNSIQHRSPHPREILLILNNFLLARDCRARQCEQRNIVYQLSHSRSLLPFLIKKLRDRIRPLTAGAEHLLRIHFYNIHAGSVILPAQIGFIVHHHFVY